MHQLTRTEFTAKVANTSNAGDEGGDGVQTPWGSSETSFQSLYRQALRDTHSDSGTSLGELHCSAERLQRPHSIGVLLVGGCGGSSSGGRGRGCGGVDLRHTDGITHRDPTAEHTAGEHCATALALETVVVGDHKARRSLAHRDRRRRGTWIQNGRRRRRRRRRANCLVATGGSEDAKESQFELSAVLRRELRTSREFDERTVGGEGGACENAGECATDF
mmetsp:Transcript_37844/g.95108  ORF Transcript_37844/g.95108 Transcript_37844/m.95108 type:complete len:220 (+) Transcript_37844:637-1296(+)